jgi:hypothetical protein
VSNELKKRAISASPAGVRTIWPRRDLQTFQQRLKTLSAKEKARLPGLSGIRFECLSRAS